MRYKLLGRSGLRVSELALGTMTFGEDWGWGASKTESRKMFDAFVEAGGNFIDTSVNYTNGTSERYVGEFIESNRDKFVVATKYSLRDDHADKADPNAGGNHRKSMIRAVETSLRNLKTEYVDLYYLHMWDFTTPIEEVMRAMDDLVRSGKVLYVGFSDTPAWVIARANTLAEMRGWSRAAAVQVPYSLASRDPERELLPLAQADDMAFAAWGVLEGGELTGKYRDKDAVKRYGSASEARMQLADELGKMAKEIGRTPSQITINWVRQRPLSGAPIIPILGARSLEQTKDNLGALDFELTQEQLARLDELSPIKLGFPRDFLESEDIRELLFGHTFAQLDNHRRPLVKP